MKQHRGHKTASHLARVNIGLGFIADFEAVGEEVNGFWIFFGDIKFYAGSIESEHVCRERVDSLLDRIGEIHYALEY